MKDCIFCRIIAGEIPANIIYQNDVFIAFHDINPQAPIHVLLIPKEHIPTINDISSNHKQKIGHILSCSGKIAKKLGIHDNGYRIVANCNADGGQEIFHLHFHLLGGRKLSWPPG